MRIKRRIPSSFLSSEYAGMPLLLNSLKSSRSSGWNWHENERRMFFVSKRFRNIPILVGAILRNFVFLFSSLLFYNLVSGSFNLLITINIIVREKFHSCFFPVLIWIIWQEQVSKILTVPSCWDKLGSLLEKELCHLVPPSQHLS